jgi:hypothetical protein
MELGRLKNRQITKTPGIKRICEIEKPVSSGLISPSNIAELSQSKPSSSIGNYQISYYPNSPLNPELEERCIMLEMMRNLKNVNFHHTRIKKPKKIVRKNKVNKFDAEFRKMNKMLNFIEKTYHCIECGKNPCRCEALGSDESFSKVVRSSLQDPKKYRYTSIDNIIPPKINLNKTKLDFIGKKTKRKPRHTSLDINSLRRDLMITPCPLGGKKT